MQKKNQKKFLFFTFGILISFLSSVLTIPVPINEFFAGIHYLIFFIFNLFFLLPKTYHWAGLNQSANKIKNRLFLFFYGILTICSWLFSMLVTGLIVCHVDEKICNLKIFYW